MNVRLVRSEDFSRWQELWKGYLDFYKVELSPAQNMTVWERLMDSNDPLLGLVVVDEADQPFGFTHFFYHGTTWFQTSYAYLEDLYVDGSTRGKGAGRALINAVCQHAKEQGAAKVYWHTDEANETAQALYNKVAEKTDFIRYDIAFKD